MRPISLKVSGLQSYRQMQEIDFTELCETGLFGIFGPTGSGKSSLLDAITLAMYGKVERAVNGTQGILNHSEDALQVSFTFELLSAAGPRRYRVERRFKRTGDHTVSNTISRFIEIGEDGETVTADKLADVTRCVEDKIGLKMDDFTRAVVLPQGKFAEFLSLRGADRRQMLQRLFHLEQYGDVLGQKLSRRAKENEAALQSVAAEQQGLGSAAAEDVQAAEQRFRAATVCAAECRSRLEESLKRSERLGRIRELQEERTRRESQRQALAAREDEIVLLEQRLGQAEAAAALAPALKAWRAAEAAWRSREAESAALQARAADSETAAAAAQAAETAAAAALAAEEPGLREREAAYKRALELAEELGGLRRELAALGERRGAVSRSLEALREELDREQELLARGQKRQQELQASLQPLLVRSRERETLQEAVQRLRELEAAGTERDRAAGERRERSALLAQAERRLAEARASAQARAAERAAMLGEAAAHLEELAAAEAEANFAYEAAEQAIAEQEAAGRSREAHRLAMVLAAGLKDGEPCSVCGSLHHPAPAAPAPEHSDHAGEGGLAGARRLHKRLAEAGQGIREGRNRDLEWLAQLYGETGQEEGVVLAASAMQIDAVEELPPPDGLSVKRLEDTAESLESRLAALAGKSQSLRRKAAEWGKALAGAEQAVLKESAAVEAERGWEQATATRAAEAEAKLESLQKAWKAAFEGLSPEEAQRSHAELRHKDAQAEEIRERLERSVTFLEQKAASVQNLRQGLAELDKELAALEAQLNGKEELALEKERRLAQTTEGRDAGLMLDECRKRLRELTEAAEEGKRRAKAASEKAQTDARAAAVSGQALASAREHLDAAEGQWEQGLASSGFQSAAEAEEALLAEAEKQAASARVRSHREAEAEIALQLKDIDAKLAGAAVTDGEWQECREALSLHKREDEEALEERAKSARDLEDVRVRHLRWRELDKKRAGLDEMKIRLSKLQSCLRGNAFVEYIAEEQLMQVCQAASQRLRFLSKQRYSLEVDSGGGFVIRDDGNGGVKRPVSTLSGGETFLTSLSLALALSAQIQLRGQYPLQFFFLDEGFGTLDPDLLETVITSLERLHHDRLSVGIISHVPELRARLPRKLVIVPAQQGGEGSRIVLEKM